MRSNVLTNCPLPPKTAYYATERTRNRFKAALPASSFERALAAASFLLAAAGSPQAFPRSLNLDGGHDGLANT